MEPIGLNSSLYDQLQSSGADLERRIRAMQQKGPQTKEQKDLMKAAQDFEAFFLYMLMKEMRKTVNETPLFHGGRAEEIFRDMMDEETTKQIAATPGQGIGIAKMIYDQLSRSLVAKQIEGESAAAAPAAPAQTVVPAVPVPDESDKADKTGE